MTQPEIRAELERREATAEAIERAMLHANQEAARLSLALGNLYDEIAALKGRLAQD